jgi:hypothetical protein
MFNVKEYQKKYRAAHIKERIEYDKIYAKKNKLKRKKTNLLRSYNLDFESYNKMFEDQQHKCKVCERHINELRH